MKTTSPPVKLSFNEWIVAIRKELRELQIKNQSNVRLRLPFKNDGETQETRIKAKFASENKQAIRRLASQRLGVKRIVKY
jgi:hypothetical protein